MGTTFSNTGAAIGLTELCACKLQIKENLYDLLAPSQIDRAKNIMRIRLIIQNARSCLITWKIYLRLWRQQWEEGRSRDGFHGTRSSHSDYAADGCYSSGGTAAWSTVQVGCCWCTETPGAWNIYLMRLNANKIYVEMGRIFISAAIHTYPT